MPVGSYSGGESPYGILDLAGNVSEWVEDLYQKDHYQSASALDPIGPDTGWAVDERNPEGFEAAVARGGNLGTGDGSLRTFHRTAEPIEATSNGLGFRCVLSLK